MQESITNGESERQGRLRPLVSAASAGPQSYTKVHFDSAISSCIRQHAHERAPTRQSQFRHFVGMSGEAAVAAAFGVPVNRQLVSGFSGDSGYDLTVPSGRSEARVEVRTTTEHDQPERKVEAGEIDDADYYVLARTDAPESYVEVIGYAPRQLVKECGNDWTGGYRLRPDYLLPMGARRLGPSDVREVFQANHR